MSRPDLNGREGAGWPVEPRCLMGLESLWKATKGDHRICVAVLDGPADLSHNCFAGADLTVSNILALPTSPDGFAGRHGTHVASVIFGQHGSTVWGIAPDCRGLIIPIYASEAENSLTCSQLDLARAINQAVSLGAHVINISGGELTQSGQAEPLLAETIRRCAESGVLIVAAAGNDGCPCLHIPAAVPSVLAVGAMDAAGMPLGFSNWGQAYQGQGVLACGQDVWGAAPGDGGAKRSGTSFATPIVAGVAALLLSLQLARNQEPDPKEVRAAILETGVPCEAGAASDCARWLAGRLDIAAARDKLTPGRSGGIKMLSRADPAADDAERGVGHGVLSALVEPAVLSPGPAPPVLAGLSERIARPVSSIGMGGVITNHNQIATNEEYMSSEEQQVMDIADQETLRVSGTERGPSSGGVMMAAVSNPPAGHPDPMGVAFRASAATSPTAGVILPSAISPAECDACAAAANQRPAIAYVLGEIGYDFGTEARRDSFVQQMQPNRSPHNAADLLAHLQEDPTSAPNIIWTLSLDATVVYAIQPYGPYASVGYERLREFLDAHHTKGVERVSIPGYVKGTTRLLNGQQVPILFPELRGMYSWSTPHLVEAVLGAAPVDAAAVQLHSEKAASIGNFLERVYYELRNLGTTSQERAMNYAATDAFRLDEVFGDSLKLDLKLDSIDTQRSPICRPGSDCWDVMLTFFNPLKRLEQARRVYRMTVDVSDVIPVTVGKVRHWDMY